MLVPSFTLKRTAALRRRIQETVDRLLDAVERQGPPTELVSAFALPVPSMVICALLGVPYADRDFFRGAVPQAAARPDRRGHPGRARPAGGLGAVTTASGRTRGTGSSTNSSTNSCARGRWTARS